MVKTTILTGVALILLGVGFYLGSGRESLTALIPSAIGVLIGGCGLLGTVKSPAWLRPAAMHTALGLAVLGFAATVGGVGGTITLIQGGEVERPLASVLQTCTAVVLLIFLVLGLRSFLSARRTRKAEPSPDTPNPESTPQ
ncbi:MAG: hypothetical protein ACOC1G_05110 [Phycisphaeraceae bacterium]